MKRAADGHVPPPKRTRRKDEPRENVDCAHTHPGGYLQGLFINSELFHTCDKVEPRGSYFIIRDSRPNWFGSPPFLDAYIERKMPPIIDTIAAISDNPRPVEYFTDLLEGRCIGPPRVVDVSDSSATPEPATIIIWRILPMSDSLFAATILRTTTDTLPGGERTMTLVFKCKCEISEETE